MQTILAYNSLGLILGYSVWPITLQVKMQLLPYSLTPFSKMYLQKSYLTKNRM